MVIDGFLIITLSSGLIAAIPEITQNPGSAPLLLARQLPNAATFFLTYFVTASFAGAAGALLQIAHLAVYYVKLVLLGSTPRAVWNIKSWFPAVAWGTLVRCLPPSTVALPKSVLTRSPLDSGLR